MDFELDYFFASRMRRATILNSPNKPSIESPEFTEKAHRCLHFLPGTWGRKWERKKAELAFCRASGIYHAGQAEHEAGDFAGAARTFTQALEVLEGAPLDWPDCGTLAAAVLLGRMKTHTRGRLPDMESVAKDCDVVTCTTGRCAYATPMQCAEAYVLKATALDRMGRAGEALEAMERAADRLSKRTRVHTAAAAFGTPATRPESMHSIIAMVATCRTEAQVQAVRFILSSGFRPNQKDAENFQLPPDKQGRIAPLDMIAGRLHHIDIRVLSLFLEAGADPNSRREDWITPLIKAASQWHIEGCRILLAAGADINAKDALGFTALMVAARTPKPAEMEDIFGRDVAPVEFKAMSTRLIEFLISQGADVTHQSLQQGATALSIAAANLNAAACRLLLDAEAPPSPVTWLPVDTAGPPHIEAHCPLVVALMADSLKVPESETAALIRSRMMSGSDYDHTMVRVVDWALFYHKMAAEFQSYSRPEDPEGSAPGNAPPKGGREGAEEAIAQIQGMADWMASHAGVEAPDDAAGNPLLLISRYIHNLMPPELLKNWSRFEDLTETETEVIWQTATVHGDWVPLNYPLPHGLPGFMMRFEDYDQLVRDPLSLAYSHAIPSEEALDAIAEHAPLVEIGAGTGYWAALLRLRGCDVAAYDIAPPARGQYVNQYHHRTYTDVLPGGPGMAARHGDRALLLVWPWSADLPLDAEGEVFAGAACDACGNGPAPGTKLRRCGGCQRVKYCCSSCQKMAWKTHKPKCKAASASAAATGHRAPPEPAQPWDIAALGAFNGDVVIYVGEWEGRTIHPKHPSGCSSSPEFQEALNRDFTCIKRIALPNWRDERDDLTVWRRN